MESSQGQNPNLVMQSQGVAHHAPASYSIYNQTSSHSYGHAHPAQTRTSSYMTIANTVQYSQGQALSQTSVPQAEYPQQYISTTENSSQEDPRLAQRAAKYRRENNYYPEQGSSVPLSQMPAQLSQEANRENPVAAPYAGGAPIPGQANENGNGVVEDEYDEEEEEEEEEEIDEDVAEDIARFEESFARLRGRYRLINRIGEGTFSTVYKAEDLLYNSPNIPNDDRSIANTGRKPSRYVAIKKIYVTSSPSRVFNELQLLYDLRDAESVCPLLSAFRHEDQVIAVLALYPHDDFRDFFTKLTIHEIKTYLRSLLTALRAVHSKGIIHRDIKPTNFLYSMSKQSGSLVDFGLAERQGSESRPCLCELPTEERYARFQNSRYMAQIAAGQNNPLGYPKQDSRSSRRANRAGTRGFRAPEVLFKCTAQTTAIDIWSVGVVLLTFLTRRFPFFQSCDDVDALLELVNVFGKRKIREAGLLHGQVFCTNIPSYRDYGPTFEKLIIWCRNSERDLRTQSPNDPPLTLKEGEREAIAFMERCFDFDPSKRITAAEALEHPFLN